MENGTLKMFNLICGRHHPTRIQIRGWPASGSTCIYQMAKALGLDVKKGHGTRKKTLDFTVFTFRDPRDIICSQARRKFKDTWEEQGVEEALFSALKSFKEGGYTESLMESVKSPNIILIRYENFFPGNEGVLLDLIADTSSVRLAAETRNEILREVSMEQNATRASSLNGFKDFDGETQIHGDHISNNGLPGAWRRLFSASVEQSVTQELGQVMSQLGYLE